MLLHDSILILDFTVGAQGKGPVPNSGLPMFVIEQCIMGKQPPGVAIKNFRQEITTKRSGDPGDI